jgi:hypothetical protein
MLEWGALYADGAWGLFRQTLDTGDVDLLGSWLEEHFWEVCGCGLITPFAYQGSAGEKFRDTIIRNWSVSTGTWEELSQRGVPMGVLPAPHTLDTPRHDHYAVQIMRYLPTGGRVLEVGGGYGGVARQLQIRKSPVQIILCDLPETLYLAWYHLAENTDAAIAWWDDDPGANIVLVPGPEIGAIDTASLFFSAHSLSEMPADTALEYLGWATERGVPYIYIDQAHGGWDNNVTAPFNFPERLLFDMHLPGYVERWRRSYPWDTPQSRYCEVFFERLEA